MFVIFARVPEAGRSKTRLIPRLGAARAAALGAAMTEDVVTLVLGMGVPARVVVAGAEDQPNHPWLRTLPLPWEPQAAGDLGARLSHALRDGGVAIGTDAPTLPAPLLWDAHAALHDHDVVFAPAFDGGYTMVGVRDPSGLFEQLPWSSADTFAASHARAREMRARVAVLSFWYDVDTPDDLDFLCRHLGTLPADVAPATRRALRLPVPTPAPDAPHAAAHR